MEHRSILASAIKASEKLLQLLSLALDFRERYRPLSFTTWVGKVARAEYRSQSIREFMSGFAEDLTGTRLRSFP